jgi:hypothetical protein
MGARLEEISKRWASYLSPQVFDSIFSSGTTVSEKHRQKYLTVFFSDIVSFTDLSCYARTRTSGNIDQQLPFRNDQYCHRIRRDHK